MLIDTARRDPSTPLVTYYNQDTGERTELSTTSMLNWQAKTANLLQDSYGLSAESKVGLFLPTHWLVPVFIGAVAAIGATLVLPNTRAKDSPPPVDLDVAVIGPTELANELPSADEYLACSLLPMAAGFRDKLPVGIDDYAHDVRVHGDFFPGLTDPTECPNLQIRKWQIDKTSAEPITAQLADDLALTRGDRLLIPGGPVTTSVVLTLSKIADLAGTTSVLVDGATAGIPEQERVTRVLSRDLLAG